MSIEFKINNNFISVIYKNENVSNVMYSELIDPEKTLAQLITKCLLKNNINGLL